MQVRPFGISEQPRAGVESLAGVSFEREGTPLAVDDIDDELCMFPIPILRGTDVERHAANVAEMDVIRTDGEVGGQVAIGSAVVAAAPGLMEHQFRPVLVL